jgi:hypothetical protein
MDFEYCLAAGIIYPLIHLVSNYYVQRENWAMGMAVFTAFSHLFMKGIICGEKYKIGLLNPLEFLDCMISSIYSTEIYTIIVLFFVTCHYLNLNTLKSNSELFIIIQCLHFSLDLLKHSNIFSRITFEVLFLEIAQKLDFISQRKKLILSISSITLIFTSFHIDFLKDLNYPEFFFQFFYFFIAFGIFVKNLIYYTILAKCLIFGVFVFILSKLLPAFSISSACLSIAFYVFSKLETKVRGSSSYVHSKVHRKVLQVYFYDEKLRHVTWFLVFWIFASFGAFGYCEIKRFRYFEYFSGLSLSVLSVAFALMVTLDSEKVFKYQLFLNFVSISVSLVFVYVTSRLIL